MAAGGGQRQGAVGAEPELEDSLHAVPGPGRQSTWPCADSLTDDREGQAAKIFRLQANAGGHYSLRSAPYAPGRRPLGGLPERSRNTTS